MVYWLYLILKFNILNEIIIVKTNVLFPQTLVTNIFNLFGFSIFFNFFYPMKVIPDAYCVH